jgi:anti-sigma-K factor RskA
VVSLTRKHMNNGSLHELSAAYALDALDGDDRRAFEAHLAECERCREEVYSFRDTAAALGRDVEPRPAPEMLERRILTAARAERRNVAPLRQRWALPAAGIAAAAAGLAIGLGIWATQLSHSLDRERSARGVESRIISILSQPGAKRVPLRGNPGTLVVSPTRDGVLILDGVKRAAEGRTYEAWIVAGNKAQPAGLFRGGAGRTIVELKPQVPDNAVVAVTLEQAGGAPKPTGRPVFRSDAS